MHPLITDNVEFKGEVTLDEGDNKCNTQGRVSGDPGTEVSGCSTSIQSPLVLQSRGKLRRARRGRKAPDTLPGNYPILVKGQHVHYQPWGSQDLEGVISKLPNIHNGASKWIRTFEELTVGKLKAVGDLKALLARVLGLSKMESVLRNGGLDIMDGMHDGTTLDYYRVAMWTTLRREFPTHIDHKNMRGLPINDTENPASYLQAQLDRWRLETNEDPEIHPVFSVMFRNSVIEILPSPIKVKLDDVVGLVTNKTHREFCDHVVHAVDKYRQNEHKIQEQSKEVQSKLSQLQLEELTKREKEKKKQAVVSESVNTILQAVQQGAPQTQPPQQAFSTPVQQPQSQWSPTPPFIYTIQIHLHNTGNPTNGNRQNQNKGPKGQYINNQQQGSQGQRRGPLICYGCNMEGHIRRNCLANPYPPQQGQGNSYQGRQEQGGSYQAGPFMGQGY
ncbi:uncharacterized protein LOC130378202 [Gadus chalcogrammus]|uniref:uncharacterized protein LOC130378202 n=1 Tax=Gadus chalcogrammus TaxID=1042646 RepID=UPI0024C4443D|nr:uncharacterized protein LOC130378202 [Gadus chalcogrammus]